MQWSESISSRISEETHFGDRQIKCFDNRPSDLNRVFAEALLRNPDSEAVVSDDNRFTYAQLDTQVAALASGLHHNGVQHGDRVAMLIGNRVEFLVVLLATLRIGGIAVPVNIREQTPELLYILNHCGARLLVHEREIDNKIPQTGDLNTLQHRYSIGGATEHAHDFNDLVTRVDSTSVEPVATESVAEEDVAIILYTSGTTGLPKGAMLTHFNIVHSIMHFELCMELGDSERGLLAVPASHVTGVIAVLATMLRVAGCTVIMKTFDARSFLETAAREKITQTLIVPAMYNLFLLRCEVADYDLSSWRIGGYGGAPMPPSTVKALAEKLPQLLLINAYGSTEATSPATMLPPGTGTTHSDSVGIALPCADIRVVDENGDSLPDGEHGELFIGGPMVVPGYWNNPDKTSTEFHNGYWKSGDIGSRDKHGFFRLHDRRKDMIIRGGYNIYSAEIENVVSAIEGVIECAAIGRPDPVLGEKTELIVYTATSSISKEQICSLCESQLADYKVPDFVTFVADPLPRNANGKVVKRALRE